MHYRKCRQEYFCFATSEVTVLTYIEDCFVCIIVNAGRGIFVLQLLKDQVSCRSSFMEVLSHDSGLLHPIVYCMTSYCCV